MTTSFGLKHELNHIKAEKNSICKSVRMLNYGMEAFEKILAKGKSSCDLFGLRFLGLKIEAISHPTTKGKPKIEFFKEQNHILPSEPASSNLMVNQNLVGKSSSMWIFHFYGRRTLDLIVSVYMASTKRVLSQLLHLEEGMVCSIYSKDQTRLES